MIAAPLKTLLIVDDEQQIRRLIKVALEPHGFAVEEAADGVEATQKLATALPDAMILDLGLPDQDGLKILCSVREWYKGAILILSVRDDEESIVAALEAGANDYIRKPFLVGELLARLRLALRNQTDRDRHVLTAGDLNVDMASRRVHLGAQEVKLTTTEFELLKVLLEHQGQVLTHHQILHQVWGPNSSEHIQYLRVYIGHLRQKLETSSKGAKLIVTEPGIGYRLQARDAAPLQTMDSFALS